MKPLKLARLRKLVINSACYMNQKHHGFPYSSNESFFSGFPFCALPILSNDPSDGQTNYGKILLKDASATTETEPTLC